MIMAKVSLASPSRYLMGRISHEAPDTVLGCDDHDIENRESRDLSNRACLRSFYAENTFF